MTSASQSAAAVFHRAPGRRISGLNAIPEEVLSVTRLNARTPAIIFNCPFTANDEGRADGIRVSTIVLI